MTQFAKPVAQRPQNWLAQLRNLAAANAAGGTSFTVIFPKREAGDTRPESERGETMAINGDLRFDHEGNETGLVAPGARAIFGLAVYNVTEKKWKRVQS